MTRGSQQLVITVVPDPGTDELAGITGSMQIVNVEAARWWMTRSARSRDGRDPLRVWRRPRAGV